MFRLARVRTTSHYSVNGVVHDELCIGRAKQSDLHTEDRLISANHARLFVRGPRLWIVDLDSRNGTEVNKQRLPPFQEQALEAGDVVDFAGRLSFRVEITDEAGEGRLAVIEVEANGAIAVTGEGVLRTQRLVEEDQPSIEASTLLALNDMFIELSGKALLRANARWVERLTASLVDLLAIAQVQLHRWVDGRLVSVASGAGSAPLYPLALEQVSPGDRVVGVELIPPEGREEVTMAEGGALPAQIVSVMLAPLLLDGEPWGVLYATNESLKRRQKKLQARDLWLFERASRFVKNMLPYMTWSVTRSPSQGDTMELPALKT